MTGRTSRGEACGSARPLQRLKPRLLSLVRLSARLKSCPDTKACAKHTAFIQVSSASVAGLGVLGAMDWAGRAAGGLAIGGIDHHVKARLLELLDGVEISLAFHPQQIPPHP